MIFKSVSTGIKKANFLDVELNKCIMATFHSVIPKLPALDLLTTKLFYIEKLGFRQVGGDHPDYLMLFRDGVELHFFLDCELDVQRNDGMCYIRVSDIEGLYSSLKNASDLMHLGKLDARPWGQKEFSITDNNHNQLTFGEALST
jgi:hypothetical protein